MLDVSNLCKNLSDLITENNGQNKPNEEQCAYTFNCLTVNFFSTIDPSDIQTFKKFLSIIFISIGQ